MLPILHLNGYKIAGPTVLGRKSDEDVRSLLSGHGYDVHFVEGDEPMAVHRRFAAALDTCARRGSARSRTTRGARGRPVARPRWPAIVLRTPKGWTGPKVVDGVPVEGTFRAHQVPLANVRDNPAHLALLEAWMRSYRPEELFDDNGRLVAELAALAPAGDRRMGANPHANGGELTVPLDLPDSPRYALGPRPGAELPRIDAPARRDAARHLHAQRTRRTSACSAPTRPTRTASAPSSRSRTAASSEPDRSRSTITCRPTAA